VCAAPWPPVLDRESADFRGGFNRRSHRFRHGLVGHPLFALPRLARLAEAILARADPKRFTHVDGARPAGDVAYRESGARERTAGAVLELERPGTWIKLTCGHEIDPEYASLLEEILAELEGRTGVPLRRQITWVSPTIFLAAPNTVTPFHIDHEVTYLFQIRGSKEVHLFDPSDRSLIAEEQLERFYAGDLGVAKYRPEYQSKASVYRLVPGDAVHQPSLAPHWVRNGDEPTISMSLNFCLRELDRRARIYQVNHYARKLGASPSPPGAAPWKDAVKMAGLGFFSTKRPRSEREAVGSGLDRLLSPARLIKGWVAKTLPHQAITPGTAGRTPPAIPPTIPPAERSDEEHPPI
jgi:Cupin-like domain